MNRIVEKVNFRIPKQPKAKRVAAYARVSSGKDENQDMMNLNRKKKISFQKEKQ